MDFNFTRAALTVLLPLLAACGRPPAPPPAPPRDGTDAQRVVALLDYVGSDYGRAVQDGRVVSEAEYEEQRRFVADARRLSSGTVPVRPDSGGRLPQRIERLSRLVEDRAAPAEVASAAHDAREEAVRRFGLATSAPGRPSLSRAAAAYAANCAACHGATGRADTPRARELDPAPASFREPERLQILSPYRVYNTLTFGIPGTAMASFREALTPAERWDLAFYVFRLGHAEGMAAGEAPLTLAEMSARTDAELLDVLRTRGTTDAVAALRHARRDSAFQEPSRAEGVAATRDALRAAQEAADRGALADADRLVLDAYLQGFEPLEPSLRASQPALTVEVERGFRDVRAALSTRDLPEVRARLAVLDARLARSGGDRPVMPFLAGFLVYFREGVEAALVIGALLAGVRRLERADAARAVHLGWISALPAGLLTWWVSERVLALGAARRELMEALIALTAAAVLFSMSFWMISKVESQRWLAYLRRNVERSLDRRSLGLLGGVAFLAVYREAAETVLFTRAILADAGDAASSVWVGAASGVLAVAAVAVLMNVTARRLPVGLFFAVSSALLCALAVSFAGSGIYDLVAAGYLVPRPVPFPEVAWMGIHPDLSVLAVQFAILLVVGAGAVGTLRRRPQESSAPVQPR